MTNPATFLPKPKVTGRVSKDGDWAATRRWALDTRLSLATTVVDADTYTPYRRTEARLYARDGDVRTSAHDLNSGRINVSIESVNQPSGESATTNEVISAALDAEDAEELYRQLGEALGK